MATLLDRMVSISLIVASCAIGGSIVYRTVGPAPAPSVGPAMTPDSVSAWDALLAASVHVGGVRNAPLILLEFGDLECPYCRRLHPLLDSLVREHDDLRVGYVHYPLDFHRFALPAARAAECADVLGAFAPWVRTVFEKQDSLGLVSWGRLAHLAGIADTARIADCAGQAGEPSRIRAGREAGDAISIRGTPTVVINGWRMPGVPGRTEITAVLKAIRAGDPVVGALRSP